jgi:drug/metabolite transporter (DMT)-like permease
LLGFLAAAGQATGLILAKQGLDGDFSPISGNVIRMLAAAAVIWAYFGLRGEIPKTTRKLLNHRKAALQILGGTLFGPVIGVSFSLLAVQKTAVGIASTLIALTPIFLLPIGYLVFKERITWRATFGTFIAITGVALLFLG